MNDKYPLALPRGTVLAGQYIVERVLGQGGFGITYEATDHKTGQRVAVKEFFPDTMAARTEQTTVVPFSGERGDSFAYGKTCFLQEAETLANFIGNENIVRIHSYFEENGTAYFVMDFIEGTSFDEYLKKRGGKIPFDEAAQILVPVMDALSVVHGKGIVHRDVTPDNIYITKEGVVKLLDFGAARYSLGDQSRSLDVILKHGFAPKEQYTRRGRQGPFTDIYALGATFYFALTGKRPPDSVERMDEDDLVPPSSLGVQLSGAAEDAILKALSVQPGDRFQSMAEFKAALLSVRQPAPQPAMAGAPGQSAVVQTYFTAPEQNSIPRPAAAPQQAAQSPGSPPAMGAVSDTSVRPDAKKPGKKFPVVPVAAAAAAFAAAVILLVVILIKPGRSAPDSPSDIPGTPDTSEQTPTGDDTTLPGADDPSTEPARKLDFTPVGNFPRNIMNNGLIVFDSKGKACWIESKGTALYSEGEERYLVDSGLGYHMHDLSYVDGKLYFVIRDNGAVVYDPNTRSLEAAPYLQDFNNANILHMFVTQDCYVIGVEGETVQVGSNKLTSADVYLVSRTDGQTVKCCTALGANSFTISDDGLLFYVGHENDLEEGILGIYRVDLATMERSNALVYGITTSTMPTCPIVCGKYVYACYYDTTDKNNYAIIRFEPNSSTDGIVTWNIGPKLNVPMITEAINNTDYAVLNISPNQKLIYLSIVDAQSSIPSLYKMKGNDDGTFETESVSDQAYCPNIIVYSNNDYELDYMHYNEEKKSYTLAFIILDENGNKITYSN